MSGPPASEPGNAPPAAVILVVDDDRGIVNALARTLTARGHVVVKAQTQKEALACMEEREFHLAILDINLTGGDGIELLAQVKARAPHTEALILSGYNSFENAMRGLRAGAFDFLEKPYDDERLAHTIDRALEHRRLLQTTALYQAVQVVFRASDIERLPEAIVNVSMEVMAADAVTLLLPGFDGKFYVGHAFGLDAEVARTTRIAVGEGVAGHVISARKPLVIGGDASLHEALAGVTPRKRVRSSIVYPLVLANEVLGVLTFNRLTDDKPFGAADLDKAGVLASQVLLALENARLVRQNATVEKLAAVGQLAAGIAHEINTPMQFVGDSLYYLREAFTDLVRLIGGFEETLLRLEAAPSLDATHAILRQARDTASLEDLADMRTSVPAAIDRAAAGVERVTRIVVAVKELQGSGARGEVEANLDDCLRSALLLSFARYDGVADVDLELGVLPPVACHPGELTQVFLNLIVNAAQAVTASVAGSDRRGTIQVRARKDGDFALVSIEDSGGGIAIPIQPKIFEPFFSTKPVGQGTGLGLSTARTLVEKHGGSLTFQTQVGFGTRFSLRLPIGRT
ncbi:MAG TPA: response regulator [Polyangiaceae bacterium]|nr:response regulator [Polyangiaceae bacterium]